MNNPADINDNPTPLTHGVAVLDGARFVGWLQRCGCDWVATEDEARCIAKRRNTGPLKHIALPRA